jgi:hypothetical protein
MQPDDAADLSRKALGMNAWHHANAIRYEGQDRKRVGKLMDIQRQAYANHVGLGTMPEDDMEEEDVHIGDTNNVTYQITPDQSQKTGDSFSLAQTAKSGMGKLGTALAVTAAAGAGGLGTAALLWALSGDGDAPAPTPAPEYTDTDTNSKYRAEFIDE